MTLWIGNGFWFFNTFTMPEDDLLSFFDSLILWPHAKKIMRIRKIELKKNKKERIERMLKILEAINNEKI